MSTVVIYLGGDGPVEAPKIKGKVSAVIAADSGLELADSHGIMVNLIIGDFDSADPEIVEKYVSAGSIKEEFPTEKEVTDFELALLAAKDYEAENLIIIGGAGQRLDHLLGNISVLAGEQTSRWIVDAHFGDVNISICRPGQPRNITSKFGECISLIPVGGHVEGVSTSGLKWKLDEDSFNTNFARGISNESTDENISVDVKSGSLAILHGPLESVENEQ